MDRKKSKTKSAFSKEDREDIVRRIEKLTDPDHYTKIFYILTEDESIDYTHNSNGVFLNLTVVSDETLYRIEKFLAKLDKINRKSKTIELDEDVVPTGIGCSTDDRMYRLSNYEKNIIKQKNRDPKDDDTEYQEINFSTTKKKSRKKHLEG